MLEYIINKIMEKKGLQVVPKSWTSTYMEMVKKQDELIRLKDISDESLEMVVQQYNELLAEFTEHAPLSVLKEQIEAAGDKCPSNKDKAKEVYLEIFQIEFMKNNEETFAVENTTAVTKTTNKKKVAI